AVDEQQTDGPSPLPGRVRRCGDDWRDVVLQAEPPQVVLEAVERSALARQGAAGECLAGLVLGGAAKVVNGDDLFPSRGLGTGGEKGCGPAEVTADLEDRAHATPGGRQLEQGIPLQVVQETLDVTETALPVQEIGNRLEGRYKGESHDDTGVTTHLASDRATS